MIKNTDIVTEAKEYYKDKVAPSYFWDVVYIVESQDREIERLCEMLALRNKVIHKNNETLEQIKEELMYAKIKVTDASKRDFSTFPKRVKSEMNSALVNIQNSLSFIKNILEQYKTQYKK
jgi:hypothetical protein